MSVTNNPTDIRYWKNTIPDDWDIFYSREGVFGLNEPCDLDKHPNLADVCEDINGSPCESADDCTCQQDICIDVTSNQRWKTDPDTGHIYYYPVFPRLNKHGKFDYESLGLQKNDDETERIPFGSDGRQWNERDDYALVTKEYINNNEFGIIINLSFDESEDDALIDLNNNNRGMMIQDFKVLTREDDFQSAENISAFSILSKDENRKAY